MELSYFVYILKNTFINWHYVGFTRDIELRLLQHNKSLVKSTRFYKPFELIFVQIVKNSTEARRLEKFFKVRFNKEALLNILT